MRHSVEYAAVNGTDEPTVISAGDLYDAIADFKQAFEHAMASLEPSERNILRMSFVSDLSIDEIGKLYSIHRATAARRLARARARLAELTREHLRQRLDLDEGEFTSIVRLVHSQLNLSISRVLGE